MNQSEPREEAVFEAALQLPANQRASYLDDACAGDADLRRRVEVLLGAFERAGGFMKQPAAPERTVPFSLPLTEKPGDRIGRYRLMEQIGEGGCGVVYVAEQEEPVRRRVALKVIKLGMDTRQVIARFDAERQALAMMDHPNIAKIFDAGITDSPLPASGHPLPVGRGEGQGEGSANSQLSTLNPQLSPGRPYFVMELVRGVKITDYCDQHHLCPRERLDLFIQVCRAIQHAHQKGVIHRDIKPSNILVETHDPDKIGMPKVIDFGIAKATQGRLTDQTVYTAFEQFIGTPAYMSPEQARMSPDSSGDIDTRSDIYSLGVLLYELLTGKTPFDAKELLAAGLDEMRRTIREVEPIKPSTRLTQELNSKFKIQNSKSEMDSALRTPHSAFPSDLDWIVMKCLEKDRTRRYETANGLATDITRHLGNEPIVARPPSQLYRFQKSVQRNKLAFGAASAVALALAIGLAVSMAMFFRAQAEKKKAQTEAAKSQQVAQFLKNMLKGVDPFVALGRDTTILQDILDRTAERISTDLTNQPEVEAELRHTIGSVYEGLRSFQKAEAMHRQALAIRRKLFGDEHLEVAKSLSNLASVLRRQGRYGEAELLYREALATRRKLQGNEHPDVADMLNGLAVVLLNQRRLAEGEALHREALAMQKKLLPEGHRDLAYTLDNLAVALQLQGKLAEGEAMYREALAIRKKNVGNEHPGVALTMTHQAYILQGQGKLPEAEALVREALAIRKKSLGIQHADVRASVDELAMLLRRQGRLAEAEAEYRQWLEGLRTELPPNDPKLAAALDSLVPILFEEGKFAEAEPLARECLVIAEKKAPDALQTYIAQAMLGTCLIRQNKYTEAEPLLLSGVEGMKQRLAIAKLPAQGKKWFKESVECLVLLYETTGQTDKAVEWKAKRRELAASEYRETASRYRGEAARGNVSALNRLAWLLATCAIPEIRDGVAAVGFAESAATATNRKDPSILDTLAAAYAEAGQFTNAVATQKEAIALVQDAKKEDFASRLRLYESNSPYRQP